MGKGEGHEAAEGRAHVAVLSPRLRQEGIIYRLQFDAGSQSFLNSFKGDVLSRFSFPMDSSKEQKAKEEEKEEKEESKSEPEKAEYVSFSVSFPLVQCLSLILSLRGYSGENLRLQDDTCHLSGSPQPVGGDQCKHLPGWWGGALLSLSGSVRILFVCFSAETTV